MRENETPAYVDRAKKAEGEERILFGKVTASVWLKFLKGVNDGTIPPFGASEWLQNEIKTALEKPEDYPIELNYGDTEFGLMEQDRQAMIKYLKEGKLEPSLHHLENDDLGRLNTMVPIYSNKLDV